MELFLRNSSKLLGTIFQDFQRRRYQYLTLSVILTVCPSQICFAFDFDSLLPFLNRLLTTTTNNKLSSSLGLLACAMHYKLPAVCYFLHLTLILCCPQSINSSKPKPNLQQTPLKPWAACLRQELCVCILQASVHTCTYGAPVNLGVWRQNKIFLDLGLCAYLAGMYRRIHWRPTARPVTPLFTGW